MRSIVLVTLVALACGKDAGKKPAPAPAPAPPVAEKGAAPDTRSLAERLGDEQKNRPADTPRPEEVFTRLTGSGVTLVDVKQVLAQTVRASFCMTARTPQGALVAVCEYSSEQAAAAGRQYSLEQFKAMSPNREIVVNKKTTLTLTTTSGPPASDVTTAKILSLFSAL